MSLPRPHPAGFPAILALLAWALALVAAPAPAGEPAAGLQELSTADEGRGWEGVGRLELAGRGFCTGALIGEGLVLTAAHCLFDKTTGARIPPDRIEFRAGWRNGRAEAYRGVRRVAVHPDYAYGNEVALERVAADIALLELDAPIRTGRILPFAVAEAPGRGAEVGVVSYAQDRQEAPSLQDVCHVLQTGGGVAMLSCDVDFGASGAPVFQWAADGPRIVSVVSAKAMAGGEAVALASAAARDFGRLRAALGAGQEPILRGGGAAGAKFVRP